MFFITSALAKEKLFIYNEYVRKEGHLVKETQKKEEEGWFEEYEGQLAIDVYQTNESIVLKAPIAGVKPADLEISIADEMVTIKGKRSQDTEVEANSFFCQECYWGAFSRQYILPILVDSDKAQANLKDGILTIVIPKQEKAKTRIIKVNPQ